MSETQPPQDHDAREQEDARGSVSSPSQSKPPSAPKPESDTGIVPDVTSPTVEDEELNADDIDIFTLKPVSALKLLCRNIDAIVQLTGDVPPTPPASSAMRSMSVPNIERKTSLSAFSPRKDSMNHNLQVPGAQDQFVHEQIDGVPFKKTPIGSPESGLCEPGSPEHNDVGYNAPPLQIQYSALARKFYSKRPPPISTEEYLLRMHKYCPMSTAVYLATSYYITRLACVEKIIPVTPRNVHRLALAGLRVAMKALEDLSWPHARFSKVGGVSEAELGRLEVTFCFLMDFTLKVDPDMLQNEAENVCRGSTSIDAVSLRGATDVRKMELKIPEGRSRAATVGTTSGVHTPSRTPEKRKASTTLPERPAFNCGIEVMGQS